MGGFRVALPQKKERNSTHIAHIAKASQAKAEAEVLSKSATDRRELTNTIKIKTDVSNFAIALVTIDLIYLYYGFNKFTYQKHGLQPLH